uniref:Uncharacterized protein n=1 Tax=Leptocylindrus danicus TaxID=163516 RepID=A0A6U2RCB4_9STRA|mmetsp:Transcript_33783/g.48918  ORF Transcript_33783/g.48918 Transcript_33783/m.48918 type:complete len:116 (+) Transcript_33783:155-502(+)
MYGARSLTEQKFSDHVNRNVPRASPMAELIREAVLEGIDTLEEDQQREVRSLADDLGKVISSWEVAALDKDGELKPYIGEMLRFKSHTKTRVRGKRRQARMIQVAQNLKKAMIEF